jgi:GNAT superfamily N-acetyltransferase
LQDDEDKKSIEKMINADQEWRWYLWYSALFKVKDCDYYNPAFVLKYDWVVIWYAHAEYFPVSRNIEIEYFYMHKDHRRKWYSKFLIDAIMDEFADVDTFIVMVMSSNEPMKKVMCSLWFDVCGRIPKKFIREGNPEDAIIFYYNRM